MSIRVCRFIKWSQGAANYKSRRTELLPLLERCTRQLQANARYRDDVRYLRVWIQYVRHRCRLMPAFVPVTDGL